ncbi:MAG: dTDP-4-dehydrorhamnose reductase [Anaerolineaceae bacterium]|nr:MAG: dTDP-4-dehydrorhamnose reductase [Anaerolineaceae bacterium]
MTRILVTGASGLLGLNLALSASERHTVTGVDRCKLSGVPFDLICANLLDRGTVDRVLDTARPDWLIHCAALANLEACEADPDLARRLNADLPGGLAAACARRGVKMVHISTDSVFDGTKEEPYTEADAPSPVGMYPVTKLEGEQNVLAADPKAAVARVNFFGWSLGGKRSISEFFFNNLSAGKRCNGFTDVWFCPIFVGDLADTLLRMLEKGLSGLYHATGSDALTKYEFGVRLARRFGFDETLIDPISVGQSELTARRSPILRLSVHKLSTALGMEIPGVSTGLDRFYTQFQQGYPQKIRSYAQGESTQVNK